METATAGDTIAKTWSSARQSTIARLQSRPCDSGGPATNRPAPPAHGTTCRPSRRCSRAAVLAGDQRGQRLTGSSTAGCRCEMNHSAHPLALSNHFPPPTDCPGSIRPSSSVKPRGAIHVRTLAPRAHTDVGATGDLPARTARTRCLPASQVFHLDLLQRLRAGQHSDATGESRMQHGPSPFGALYEPRRCLATSGGRRRRYWRLRCWFGHGSSRQMLSAADAVEKVGGRGRSFVQCACDCLMDGLLEPTAIFHAHMPCAVHAAVWVHLVGLG